VISQLLDGKRVCICAGSGGVGKTTTSAAIALGMAAEGAKVAMGTSDPALRLADALPQFPALAARLADAPNTSDERGALTASRRLRRVTKPPIAVGFGISNAKQFAEVGKFADAVVVGSAIVETIEQNRGHEAAAVGRFVKELSAGSHDLTKSNWPTAEAR